MTESQKEIIVEVITEKMKKFPRAEIKLSRLMQSVISKANEVYYVNCEYPRDYSEFKNIFEDITINKKTIEGKTFELRESGFLDGWGMYPTDTYVVKHVPKTRSRKVNSTVNPRLSSK
jgi:hypothetical protein